MEHRGIVILAGVLAVVMSFFVVSIVSIIAQNTAPAPEGVPALPYVQWGSLKIGSQPVKDGLPVDALINGVSCGQPSTTKDGLYLILVKGSCGSSPDIALRVNGVQMGSAKWSSGSVVRQDVTLRPQDLRKDIREFVGNR
ncbi:MAG: hypothetical protein HY367_01920 [Candidatus Aenigmarchaeota archaeon]|nr:hypothetical protein [Candidatus Aenigmarchaeota archaeon]